MKKWLGPGSLKERVLFGDFGGAQWNKFYCEDVLLICGAEKR
jgi:hypothetical protein